MGYENVISIQELQPHLGDSECVVVDCRFSLANTERGREDYLRNHIPGAVYAHLDEHLSGPVIPGETGRHPLPEIDAFCHTLSSWGISNDSQVVVYDDACGAIAARLWWMMLWLGHDSVALLDGGWPLWVAGGHPCHSGAEKRKQSVFIPRPRPELAVSISDVNRIRTDPAFRLVDAREAERYRGEVEPIDPVAGHIPGALSVPYRENLDSAGCFLPAEELRKRYSVSLGDTSADKTVFYCGSGVTASHNLVAMSHAGLGLGKLYLGSWSEWITDPNRPVAGEFK
jgi:thiosulfate/3-mercaptopyruvate sulfurtransferase